MFNLKPLTKLVQTKQLTPYLAACLLFSSSIAFASGDISFTADQVYPECASWNAKDKTFIVSSVHQGTIGKVNLKGEYKPFITDEKLVASIGLQVDAKHNILWVANSDNGASTRSSPETSGKLAALVAYDASSGKRLAYYELSHLIEGPHFANDLTFDAQGNVYVTDSLSPVIYRVDAKGNASVFAKSDLFAGEGYNLNGIVYHPKGFLLVAKYSSGELFKINIKDPSKIEKVVLPEALNGLDGLLLRTPDKLIAVQNNGVDRTLELSSKDDWKSASLKPLQKSALAFPTTATLVGNDVYVLNSQLNTLLSPTEAKVSQYLLQKQ
jgi:sugar lactone lactonase YvrE